MTGTTWANVHIGDTVRGADQRGWEVIGRREAPEWIAGGPHAVFTLRLDGRGVRTIDRSLVDPVDLIGYDDRGQIHVAAQTLIDAGLGVALIEETTTVSDATEMLQGTAAHPSGEPMQPAPSEPRRDRWGRYVLPDPVTGVERSWTRATTIARTLADEYHLTLWKLRMVAKGLALRPDLIAGAAAADPDEDKSTLNSIAEQAMERAGSAAGANIGTALHTFTARLDRGEPLASLGAPAPLDADLRAYQAALAAHRLRVRAVERIVICPELGAAGTFDRIVEQPAGVTKSEPLSILDNKTGKGIELGMLEIAIQLAIYAHSTHMWNAAAGAYEPMPPVDLDRALVLHLPAGQAAPVLYAINIIEGWRAAQIAMQVRDARTAAKRWSWLVEPSPADLARHRVTIARSRADLAQLWEWAAPQGLWTDELAQLANLRLAEVESAA